MRRLVLYPRPELGQSTHGYLEMLADLNGYPSIISMLSNTLGSREYEKDGFSKCQLMKLTGHGDAELQELKLIPSKSHEQPFFWFGCVALPSYHLRKNEMICPYCYKENDGIRLAKWRIAWLPTCLKHQCFLEKEDALLVGNMLSANDEVHDAGIFEVQKVLEALLEAESCQELVAAPSGSIISLIDGYLFKSLSDEAIKKLKNRNRKYSRRYFPLGGRDTVKFMQCVKLQMAA